MVDRPAPTHEDLGRARKVTYLLDTARALGSSTRDLERYTPEQWERLAELARVRPPSTATQVEVLRAMRHGDHVWEAARMVHGWLDSSTSPDTQEA